MTFPSVGVRRWSIRLLKLGLGLAAVGWLVTKGRLNFGSVFHSDPWVVGCLLIPLVLINLGAQAFRWFCLLRSQGIQTPLLHVMSVAWIGNFWATISPGGLGGEVARGYLIWRREPEHRDTAVVSVFSDRALGLLSFLLLGGLVSLWFAARDEATLITWSLGLVAVTFIIMAALSLPVLQWVGTHFKAPSPLLEWTNAGRRFIREAIQNPQWITASVILSLIAALALCAGFSAAALALSSPLDLRRSLLIVPHLVIVNSLPITPGGVGVGEATASLLFEEIGRLDGAEIMLLVRSVIYLLRLPGALLIYAPNR